MESVPAYAAVAAASVGAVLDLRLRRIPNWLTGSALIVGLLTNALLAGLDGAVLALGGAALGLGLLLPFYVMRAMGAGDVKLLAGLGALVGPHALISVAVYGGIAGGLLSLAVLLRRGQLFHLVQRVLVLRTVPAPTGHTAPYGVAIASGLILSMLLPAVLA